MRDERFTMSFILSRSFVAGTFGMPRGDLWDLQLKRIAANPIPGEMPDGIDNSQFDLCINWLASEGALRADDRVFLTAYGISRMMVKARLAIGNLRPYMLHEDMEEMAALSEQNLRAGAGRLTIHEIMWAFAR